ncbi:MAG: serine hydrolase [Blautia sp.]|jgi:beta-lactamase class A
MKQNPKEPGDSQKPQKFSFWKEGPPFFVHLILLGLILAVIGCFLLIYQKNSCSPVPSAPALVQAESEEDAAGGFEAVDPNDLPEGDMLPSGEHAGENETADGLSSGADSGANKTSGGSASGQLLDNLQQQLEGRLAELSELHGGTWAIYVQSLTTGAYCSLGDGKMPAASLIKLFIMGAVYEEYDTLAETAGSENLKAQVKAMIAASDNQAANALLALLGNGDTAAGMDKVNAFCQAKGYGNTHIGRLLGESSPVDENYTSVMDCGHFLSDLYNNSENLTYPEVMLHHLREQTQKEKIPAGIPDGAAKTANKTGELPGVENDAAIIYEAPRNDYILCIMTQELKDTEDVRASIAELSNQIYGYFNQ